MKIPLSSKLGLLFGILNSLIWYLVAKKLGYYSADVYFTMNFVIILMLICGIFLSVFLTRKSNNGFIEFKNALKAGMLFTVILAIINAVFSYVYHNIITPDTVEYFLSIAKDEAEVLDLKGEELANYMDMAKSFFKSYRLIPSVLFFGLIISLLAGAVFQRKDPNTSTEAV